MTEMRSWLRGRRTGLMAFGFICALVIGGLGWVTNAALCLEQEQAETRAQAEHAEVRRLWQREQEHQAEIQQRERQQREADVQGQFAARLKLALWLLDSRIAPVLAREDTRPYSHYSAIFAPSVVLDDKGTAYDEAQVFEPSPLLNADMPDWMLLHFQTTLEAGWGSPQVPPADQVKQLVKNRIQLSNVTTERRNLLTDTAVNTSNSLLIEQVQKEQEKQAGGAAGQQFNGVIQQVVPGDARNNKDKKGQDSQRDGSNQYANSTNPMTRAQPGKGSEQETRQFFLLMENSKVFTQNAAYQGQLPLKGAAWQSYEKQHPNSEQVVIRLSPMIPLWLPGQDSSARLMVARRVVILGRIPDRVLVQMVWPQPGLPMNLAVASVCQYRKVPYPREVCQGILLDWPRLQKLLVNEIAELFPHAQFLPVQGEVPPHPDRTMTALPVELDPGEAPVVEMVPAPPGDPEPRLVAPAVVGWTPLRVGLALAWAAALLALGAVGLGGLSLIDLSERRIRFVSAVTHELRTPLTTLRLYLDMLTGGLVTGEQQREKYLDTLHQETERLHRLVSNVLDFSRLENQRPRLEKKPVTVTEVLESVRAAWETHCHDCGKQLQIDNRVESGLQVVTDLHIVQQILGNLIDNACKYSRGAEDARLWLRALCEDSSLVLEVEDRGPGVAPSERRSIFRPFCRGHGVEVTAGGVGLGLALAVRWAQLLGGSLTLLPAMEGTGARFRLALPLA
jgi:signal transduction histidine kinase